MSEILKLGAVAKVVTDQYGIGTKLQFTWRHEMLATAMSGFLSVVVVPEPAAAAAIAPVKVDVVPSLLKVAFASGTTERISGAIDPPDAAGCPGKAWRASCLYPGCATIRASRIRSPQRAVSRNNVSRNSSGGP